MFVFFYIFLFRSIIPTSALVWNTGTESDLPRSHIPDERSGHGHQGHPIVSKCPAHRCTVRCVGPKVFPTDNSVFHLRPHTADVNQLVVGVNVTYVPFRRLRKFLFCFRWFFAMISISGVFAVTFSVVFAYVADVTTVEDRSRAYGLVSATFAASLVTVTKYQQTYDWFLTVFFFLLGHFTCPRRLSEWQIFRTSYSSFSDSDRSPRCIFYPSSSAGKLTGKGATQFLGCTDQLGTGRSLCCKFQIP